MRTRQSCYAQKKAERKKEIQRIWTAWEKKVRVKTDKETDRKRQIRHKRIRDANTDRTLRHGEGTERDRRDKQTDMSTLSYSDTQTNTQSQKRRQRMRKKEK